jgi:hypothetical protein
MPQPVTYMLTEKLCYPSSPPCKEGIPCQETMNA